jgi:hypothetical protein
MYDIVKENGKKAKTVAHNCQLGKFIRKYCLANLYNLKQSLCRIFKKGHTTEDAARVGGQKSNRDSILYVDTGIIKKL